MTNEKELLLRQLEEQRFLPVTKVTEALYKKYALLVDFSDPDDISRLLFYEGEYYYRSGNITKALRSLSRCIQAPKSADLKRLEAKAHNLTGLIYYYLGQEALAKSNFLDYLKMAQDHHFTSDVSIAYTNLGLLHASLEDYETALDYETKSLENQKEQDDFHYNATLISLTHQGIYQSMLGNFTEGASLCSKARQYCIEGQSLIYEVPFLSLQLMTAFYQKDWETYQKTTERILDLVSLEGSFLALSRYFFDICDFFIDNERKQEARALLDRMQSDIVSLPLVFLRYNIRKHEVYYADKFCSDLEYMENAQKLIDLIPSYEKEQYLAKSYSLDYVERVHHARNLSKKYSEESKRDPMTGLLNKYTLWFLIDEYINTRPQNTVCAALLIDIDHLKQINDTIGHLAGDRIITETAAVIREVFSQNTFSGRIGGDEFLVFVQSADDHAAMFLQAELLRQQIFNRLSVSNPAAAATASIGIAFTSDTVKNCDMLFAAANSALAEAKSESVNRVAAAKQ